MRYVCSKQGEATRCLVNRQHTHNHRREEWVTDNKVPVCDVHNLQMEPRPHRPTV
jgi:hypothetical protein